MKEHRARKRFGQNFLQDTRIIQDIVNAVRPQPGDTVIEIGPGLAAITAPLAAKLDVLHVVEIDRDIVARLQKLPFANKLVIHQGDVLQFDFASVPGKKKIVGNLPYNISTPLLFRFSEVVSDIIDMHFMLQKEVVERMVAAPSTPAYGRLSVMLQYHLHMEYLFTVPPEAFDPAPKVESAFVRCVPHASLPHVANNTALFAKVVLAAFGQRRKTLRNTLKDWLKDEDFSTLQVDSQLRAENLSVADFVKIANYVS